MRWKAKDLRFSMWSFGARYLRLYMLKTMLGCVCRLCMVGEGHVTACLYVTSHSY